MALVSREIRFFAFFAIILNVTPSKSFKVDPRTCNDLRRLKLAASQVVILEAEMRLPIPDVNCLFKSLQ